MENNLEVKSLDEKINQIIKSVDTNDLYSNDDEDISKDDYERIEQGYKALNKRLSATEKNRWNYTPAGYMSKRLISKHLNSLKNGLFSVFPIPCKQGKCPYGDSCIALQNNMEPPYGEPCILEVVKIENLIVGYSMDFNIDSASTSDRVLIQELIQLDLLMDRCQILMSKDVDILQEVTIGTTEDGDTFTQPVVSRYLDAWERLSKRRQSVLNEMMATRHSKKGLKNEGINEEEKILEIINSAHFTDVEERPDKFKDQ